MVAFRDCGENRQDCGERDQVPLVRQHPPPGGRKGVGHGRIPAGACRDLRIEATKRTRKTSSTVAAVKAIRICACRAGWSPAVALMGRCDSMTTAVRR